MKRLYAILLTLGSALLFTGCDLAEKIKDNSEPEVVVDKSPVYEFTALISAEQIMPDAYDIKNPYYFAWEDGYSISCYSSQESNLKMELVSGKFTYRGKFRCKTEKALKDTDEYIMVYPYTEEGPLADGTFHGHLDDTQTVGNLDTLQAMGMLVKASYDAYGNSEVAACTMNRPGAIMRVSVTGHGEKIERISVRRQDGKPIAGDFTISDFSTMEPVFAEGQSDSITYVMPEPLVLTTTPQDVDIVMPAAKFEGGIAIRLIADDGSSDDNLVAGPITFTHGVINKVKNANFGLYLIWSSGPLMMDENGFRFANIEVNGGDRTVGFYFKYKSSCGIDAADPDLVVNPASYNKDSVRIWTFDPATGKASMKIGKYTDVPSKDFVDPCTMVPVKEGEPSWVLPTLAQMQVWAKKDLTLNKHNQVLSVTTDPRNRYNNDDASLNTGVKTLYGLYEAVTSKVLVYRSSYLLENGDKAPKDDNFCDMWYDTGDDSTLKFFGLAINNSSVKQTAAAADMAFQIRCCREVEELPETE